MNQTVKQATTPVAELFQMQTVFFQRALEDIQEEDAALRLTEETNPINWLTGHIVSCRYMLANMIGLQVAEPFPDLFGKLKGFDPDAEYPSLVNLQRHWPEISSQLLEQLKALSPEALQKEAFGGKLLDIILFFAYHEAYHIGQLGLLRKGLGYPALQHN